MILFYKKKHNFNSVNISNLFFKINQVKLPEIIHVGWWAEVRTHFSLILHVRLQKFWKKQNFKGYYMYSFKWQSHSREIFLKRIWKFGKKTKFISTCIVIIPFELYKYSSSNSSLIIKVSMFLIIVSVTLLNSFKKNLHLIDIAVSLTNFIIWKFQKYLTSKQLQGNGNRILILSYKSCLLTALQEASVRQWTLSM